jgi:hypothetical protein
MGRAWWQINDNVVIVLEAMAANPIFRKDDMAYAAAKPWKYEDEFVKAIHNSLPVREQGPFSPAGEHMRGDHLDGNAIPDCPICAHLGWLDEGFDLDDKPDIYRIVRARVGG